MDEDLPHCTKMTKAIMKEFRKYFEGLTQELEVSILLYTVLPLPLMFFQDSLGDISFTADLWSSKTHYLYLAITTHWIAHKGPPNSLTMCRALIAFHRVREKHSGEWLARIVLSITDQAKITAKVRTFYFL